MFRYIVALWDQNSMAQRMAARELEKKLRHKPGARWRRCFQSAGVDVFVDRETCSSSAVPLAKNGGVVLGTLFPRCNGSAPSKRKTTLSNVETEQILKTQGRALISHYWGRYVALLVDAATSTKWVLRDPTAMLDCLHARWRGLRMYFSALDGFADMNGVSLSVNWKYVTTALSTRIFDIALTGLNEVTRLVGGECHEIKSEGVRTHEYWRASDFVSSDTIADREEAIEAVRETTTACVTSWAACHGKILHLLSGGLDSAIVLTCLGHTRCSLVCANAYYTRGANNDERRYARAVARSAALQLREWEPEPTFDARRVLSPPLTSEWGNWLGYLAWYDKMRALARKEAVDAVYSGTGGDEVFFRHGPWYAFGDQVRLHGLSRAAIALAWCSARIQNASVWRVVYRGLRDAILRDPVDVRVPEWSASPLLTEAAARYVGKRNEFLHPWLLRAGRVPLGKLVQMSLLALGRDTDDPYYSDGDPENVAPLLSQPLIELCLRIETPVLAADGWDRLVARRAFEERVWKDVIWRRSKSYISEFFNHVVSFNSGIISDVLLDGELVKSQIVERARLEELLRNPFGRSAGHGLHVCTLFSIEAWLGTVKVYASQSRRPDFGAVTVL